MLDLRAHHLPLREEIDHAIQSVIDSGQFVLGEHVASFEEHFAKYCGAKYGIAVNSGTSALHLALLAAGVGPGDEVITVPFTFVATAAAIQYTGARPVFVDIESNYLTMDVNQLESAITGRTKAILPVHLYGHPADMDAILVVARRHGLTVIEDAAQAHLAEYHGRRVGVLGDLGCFSFYPAKNLGALGEGGIVVTDNPQYARAISMMRDWGQDQKYHHALKGFNYRMPAIQGAVLDVKLRYLEQWTAQRRQGAALYNSLLRASTMRTPVEMSRAFHVYHQYVIHTQNRDGLQHHLAKKGIETAIHYPIPVHLQECFRDLGYHEGDFPVTEACAAAVLSLPLYPELSTTQIHEVADAIKNFQPTPHAAPSAVGRQQ